MMRASLLRTGAAAAILAAGAPAQAQTGGGFVFAKASAVDQRDSPLNPQDLFGSSSETLEFAALVEGDRAGFRWRARGSAVRADPGSSVFKFQVEELAYSRPLGDGWTVAVGKQIRSWDLGVSFQPIGFFRSPIDIRDITDFEGRTSGLPMVVLTHLSNRVNVEAIASDRLSGGSSADRLNARQWALRLSSQPLPGLDTALIVRQRAGARPGFGATLSYAAGTMEFHADAFVGPPEAALISIAFGGPPRLFTVNPVALQTTGPVTVRGLVGLTWAPRATVTFTAELFHEGSGLSSAGWGRFLAKVGADGAALAGGSARLAVENLAWDLASLRGMARRDYLFIRASVGPDPAAIAVSALVGTADRGASVTITKGLALGRELAMFFALTRQFGSSRSEFGFSPIRTVANLSLKRSFN